MELNFAKAEKSVLIDMVKLSQKQDLKGEKGGWKEFMKVYDKKGGTSVSDPSRRSRSDLVAFLTTFKTKEDQEDLKLLARVMRCRANREVFQKFKEESPDKETPVQRLIRMTLEHQDYPVYFSFPSYTKDWFVTKIGMKSILKVMNSTSMLAIHCQMLRCEDGQKVVVRVRAMTSDLTVVLDEFVKPEKAVVEFKTEITGVTAEDLEKATGSVTDIQKKVRSLLSKKTILVGHSLHNDLKVLKIDHARVIDTSIIFQYANARNTRRPSLNNLCKLVLGGEVRMKNTAHHCVDNAAHNCAAAMNLVLAVVDRGNDTTIAQSEKMLEAEETRLEVEKKKLFLHQISKDVSSKDLKRQITGRFTLKVKPTKKEGGFNNAVVVFNTPEEAKQAFENINGNVLQDRNGLPQKLLKFNLMRSGEESSFYVRKVVVEDSDDSESSTSTEERNESCKRQRRS